MGNEGTPGYCQWCGPTERPLLVTALVDVGECYSYRLWFCSLECARKATEDLFVRVDFDAAMEADMSVAPAPFAGAV